MPPGYEPGRAKTSTTLVSLAVLEPYGTEAVSEMVKTRPVKEQFVLLASELMLLAIIASSTGPPFTECPRKNCPSFNE
jgi:hypothetical protein